MEALHVGQRVNFDEKIYTISEITRPLGTYNMYKLIRRGNTRDVFRYQLDTNFDFDSDDDGFLATINLEELQFVQRQQVGNNNVGAARFATVTDEDLDDLQKKKNEKNTDKKTQWGVRVFKDWLLVNDFPADFERLDGQQLNQKLRRFYAEARRRPQKADIYSKSALVRMRAAINRHLNAPPFHSTMTLMTDREFTSSNHVLQGLVKEHMRQGLNVTEHKEAISEGDLRKMYTSRTLATDSPLSLIRKVWFEIE